MILTSSIDEATEDERGGESVKCLEQKPNLLCPTSQGQGEFFNSSGSVTTIMLSCVAFASGLLGSS